MLNEERLPADRAGLERRTLLRAVGGLLTVAGLAGCSGVTGTPPSPTATPIPVGPRPDYAAWVSESDLTTAVDTGEPFGLIRTDLAALSALAEDESSPPVLTPGSDDEESVLLMAPLASAIGFVLVVGFGLFPYGRLTQAMFAGFGEDPAASPHEVAAGLVVGETVVFTGSFDTAELGAVSGFEQADERDGFALYEGLEQEEAMFDTAGLAYAVRDDTVVIAVPPRDGGPFETTSPTPTPTPTPAPDEPTRGRALIDARLDAFSGRVARAVETNDDFDWVLRAGGSDAFAFASHGSQQVDPVVVPDSESGQSTPAGPFDDQAAVLEDARTLANSVSIHEGGDRATSSLGAVYETAEAVPEPARFEALLEGANEATVTIKDRRVLLRGEWSDLALDETPSGADV